MNIRHTLYLIPAAAVLLLAATACTQDELADDTRLPEGEYPLIINATGLSVEATPASTRATVDGDWDGVTSVALSLGDETKEYNVTTTDAEKKTATLSNNLSPFWWTSRNDITVSAWWPCKDGEDNFLTTMPAVVVKADQSTVNDFAASDYISAENQTVRFDNPTLTFSHRTVRVTIILREGAGINNLTGAEVYVTGLSTDNGNPATISTYTPSDKTYEADRCGRRAIHTSGLEWRHLLLPPEEQRGAGSQQPLHLHRRCHCQGAGADRLHHRRLG